jgi:hypothetical protein
MEDKFNKNLEEEIDIKKINQLKKMESRIIRTELKPKNIFSKKNENLNDKIPNDIKKSQDIEENYDINFQKENEKLIKHANFYHNFSEYNVNVIDIIPLFLRKENYAMKNNLDNSK